MSRRELWCSVLLFGVGTAAACGSGESARGDGEAHGGGSAGRAGMGGSAGGGAGGRGGATQTGGAGGSSGASGDSGDGGDAGTPSSGGGAGREGEAGAGGDGGAGASDAGAAGAAGNDAGAGGEGATGGTPLGDGTCSADGWCWVEPHPHGHNYLDSAQIGGHLWAVGHGGTITHRAPDGIFSTRVWPDLPVLRGVTALAPDDVWIVGDGGLILHLEDGEWVNAPSPTTIPLNDVLAFAADDIWAVGGDPSRAPGIILHYDGDAWSVDESFAGQFFALGGRADDLWAAGYGSGGLLARRTGGAWQWASIGGAEGLQTFTAVTSFRGDLYVASTSGTLWRRQGTTWGRVTLGYTEPQYGLAVEDDALFILNDRSIRRYDGQSAIEQLRFTTIGPGAIVSGSAGLFVAGAAGRVFEHGESGFELACGSPWRGTGHVGRVIARADDDVWWLGIRTLHFDGTSWSGGLVPDEPPDAAPGTLFTFYNRTVYRWSGSAWETSVELPEVVWDIHEAGPEDVWTVGEAGTIFHYDGDDWARVNAGPGITSTLVGVHGSGSDNVWFAGLNILRRFDGESWHDEWPEHPNVSLATVHVIGRDSVWTGDTSGGVHHWDGGGWTSYTIEGAIWVDAIAAFDDSDIWAAGLTIGNRSLAAHFDGVSWTRKSVPYAYGTGPLAIQDENTIWMSGNGALLRWRRQAP